MNGSASSTGGWIPRRRDGVAEETFGDERLLVDLVAARQHQLNPTAAAIWDAVDGRRDADEVVADLARAHGLAPGEIEGQVAETLGALAELGLLRPPPAPAPAPAPDPDPPTTDRASGGGCSGCGPSTPPPTPPDPLAGRDRAGPWDHELGPYQVGATTLGLRLDDGELAARLAATLDPLATDGEVACWCTVGTVVDDPGLRHAEVDGRVLCTAAPERTELLVRAEVTRLAVTAAPGVPLHAAGIADRAGSVLLPGHSGSGKSTLVAALARVGHDCLGDEVVSVDPTDLRVVGHPKAISLDVAALAGLGIDPGELSPADVAGDHHVPITALGGSTVRSARPVALIAFPGPEPGAAPDAVLLSPIDAATRLVRDVFLARLDAEAVALAARLARRVPCWALTYDRPGQGAALVEELLDGLR